LGVRVLGRTVRSNGLPSGHIDLNRHHPGLKENFLKGVVVVKVHSAPFQREVVKNKATKDVEWLSGVSVAAGVIREEPWRVIFVLQNGFVEEHKRPGEREATRCVPFDPNPLEGAPHSLGHGAIQKTMLGSFLGARIAHFALGGDSHELKLGADREALIEGEPDECAHFS